MSLIVLQVEEERAIFDHMDEKEYERRQQTRINDDFIVDDEGYGYKDEGGEIWEYEDNRKEPTRQAKKRKIDPLNKNIG